MAGRRRGGDVSRLFDDAPDPSIRVWLKRDEDARIRMFARTPPAPLLIVLALTAGLCGVFVVPPLDRDEARYAQATAQMLETGDFVEIRFQDAARNKKPVGVHWLQAASVAALSSAEARAIWAYRIPSVLCFIIAVLATFWTGKRLLGPEQARAGAALLAVCVLGGVEAGIAKTDAALLAATTVAMAALAAFYRGAGAGAIVTFWLAVAAGVLLKGPVTPMIAGLALLFLIAVERNGRWATRLVWPPFGLALGVAVAAPWFVAIGALTEGAFFMDALGKDLGPKMISGHESHGGPVGFHTLLLPFLIWPATLFLLPGLVQGAKAIRSPLMTRERDGLRFLMAWAIPSWLLFEVTPTKLAHYPLPLYPALALLAGSAFCAFKQHHISARRAGLTAVSVQLFTLVGLAHIVLLMLMYGLSEVPGGARPQVTSLAEGVELIGAAAAALPPLAWVAGALGAGFISFAPFGLVRAPYALLASALIAGLAWHVAATQIVAPRQDTLFVSRAVVDELEALSLHPRLSANTHPPLTSTGFSEPSLVFLTDTNTRLTTPDRAAHIAAAEAGRAAIVEARVEDAFLQRLTEVGADAVRVGRIDGLNYSRGDFVELYIYRTTRPANPAALGAALQDAAIGQAEAENGATGPSRR